MSPEDKSRCERECTRLSTDFAWTVDSHAYDAFVALFAPDGVFERAGQPCRGHEAIRQFLDARPAGRVTRHLCSNIRVDMTGPDTAMGGCSALMYHAAVEKAVSAATDAQRPLPVSAPVVVDYLDDYVLTSSGWKFKYRRTTIVFQP